MNRSYHNIERSATRRHEYTGWSADGARWRIVAEGRHWRALPPADAPLTTRSIRALTLGHLSARLELTRLTATTRTAG